MKTCLLPLIATALLVSVFLGWNVPTQAENKRLNWNHQKIGQTAPSAIATAIAGRPGSHEIAIVGDDHLVRIKDRATGKRIRVLAGHTDWIKAVVYHPNGKTLFTAGSDHKILAWNAEEPANYYRFAMEDRAITAMALDSRGQSLATVGFNNQLYLYDVQSHKRVHQLACPSTDMRAIAFSPDDQLIAVGGRNGMVRIIQAEQGTTVCDIQCHQKRIRDLVFISPNEIVTCSDDQTVRRIKISSRTSDLLIRKHAKFFSIAYLGESKIAVGGSDNLVRILDLTARQAEKTETGCLQGHRGSICELVATGHQLISAGFDTQIRIWEIDPSFINTKKSERIHLSKRGSKIAK
ncbi:MAG: hypothetical protein VX438_09910 [Planctomycetota bacterium]|nr:hypothetical protein [Planctomycetota bacterium]